MQKELNTEMILAGKAKYNKQYSKLQKAKMESRSSYGVRLSCLQLERLAQCIAIELDLYEIGSFKPIWYKYTQKYLSAHIIAMKGLEAVLDGITTARQYSTLSIAVGNALELEYKAQHMHRHYKEDMRLMQGRIQRIKKAGKRLHLKRLFLKAETDLERWTTQEKGSFGGFVLDCIRRQTGFVKRVEIIRNNKVGKVGKVGKVAMVTATPELLEWIQKFNEHESMLRPVLMPVVESPPAWEDMVGGAYDIKAMHIIRRQIYGKYVTFEELGSKPIRAINKLQETEWTLDEVMLNAVRWGITSNTTIGRLPRNDLFEPPELIKRWGGMTKFEKRERKKELRDIHLMNHDIMIGKVKALRAVGEASRIKGNTIYFPCHFDYRGRIYTYPHGPQAIEYTRCLYKFKEGKPIGSKGIDWLAIHGANMWGRRGTKEERIAWVDKNTEKIDIAATDPERSTWWRNADKPWLFLAFCKEWQGVLDHGEDFVSQLPISMDGSCNGTQIVSLILGDKRLAELTNVTPSNQPQCIYTHALDKVEECLYDGVGIDGKPLKYASGWYKVKLTRSVYKHLIMGIPYAMKPKSHLECIRDFYDQYIKDGGEQVFIRKELYPAINEIKKLIFDYISPLYTRVYKLIDALQGYVRERPDQSIKWQSPSGFHVLQHINDVRERRWQSAYDGRVLYSYDKEPTNKLNTYKMAMAIVPNYIHSHDAALVHNVVSQLDVPCFTNHDCYMTLAADAEDVNLKIRQQVRDTYYYTDWVKTLEQDLEADLGLPSPDYDFDYESVADSEYMFT